MNLDSHNDRTILNSTLQLLNLQKLEELEQEAQVAFEKRRN